VIVRNDTKNIVVSNRFSLTRRACCALFCTVVETAGTLFKYLELFFKTYAALRPGADLGVVK
jgi:hypothetical protein